MLHLFECIITELILQILKNLLALLDTCLTHNGLKLPALLDIFHTHRLHLHFALNITELIEPIFKTKALPRPSVTLVECKKITVQFHWSISIDVTEPPHTTCYICPHCNAMGNNVVPL